MIWRRDGRKPVSLIAAILVQLLLVVVLVPMPPPAVREIEIVFPITLTPARAKAKPSPQPSPQPSPAHEARAILKSALRGERPEAEKAPSALFAIPKSWLATPQKPFKELGVLLFDCAPEHLAGLSPRQWTACRSAVGHTAYDPHRVDFHDHTDRAAYAALWARQKARKNAPLLLPCFNPAGMSFIYTAFCAVDVAINGYHPDQMPSYADRLRAAPPPYGELPDSVK